MSNAAMARHAGVKNMDPWLKQEGFYEWFVNGDFNRELLESAVEIAILEAMKILEAPSDGEKGSPKPGDKLSAMKIILEYSGYKPKDQAQPEYADKEIASMDEAKLDKMIESALEQSGKLSVVTE